MLSWKKKKQIKKKSYFLKERGKKRVKIKKKERNKILKEGKLFIFIIIQKNGRKKEKTIESLPKEADNLVRRKKQKTMKLSSSPALTFILKQQQYQKK